MLSPCLATLFQFLGRTALEPAQEDLGMRCYREERAPAFDIERKSPLIRIPDIHPSYSHSTNRIESVHLKAEDQLSATVQQ